MLVLYGEYDWFEDEAAHRLIVDLVNRDAPGRARLAVFPGLDHHFQRFEQRADAVDGGGGTVAEGPVVEAILAFLERVVDRRPTGDPPADTPAAEAAPLETAEASASPTLAAFHRGEALVRRALAALGGPEALRKAGGITLEGAGTFDLATRMQGMHPARPEPVPLEEALALDLAGDRLAFEAHARVNPDADEWIRSVFDGDGRRLIVLRQSGKAFWVPGEADHKGRYARIVPHVLLEDALSARGSLRHLARSGGEDLVGFQLPGGESVTLQIDADTALLRGFEYLLDLPLLGDTPVRWRFGEYRPVEGLGPYPAGYRVELGGRLLKEVRYRSVRAGVDRAPVLRLPEDLPVPEPPPPPEPSPVPAEAALQTLPEVRTLAEGVYLAVGVRPGFHVLFVELADSVLVVDAPAGYHELQMVPAIDWAGDVTSSSVGRRLLEAVRATVPGKPVGYLVLTHHHGDHAGGVRPFLDAGATVLASAVTAEAVERAARGSFRLEPDELTGWDVTPRIEVVQGERTLSDGERTVRILDVGPNPHAEGMLVIYLPEERLLYQSDLFMPSPIGFPDPARVPVMRWFVRWLDASGLEPEAIYAIHGSAKVTEEQLATIRGLDRAPGGGRDRELVRELVRGEGQP